MFIYYVYAYINKKTGLPYYIGKGKNKRAFASHGRIKVPKDKSKIIFLETNLSNTGALALERRYIRWYGRKGIDDNGILLNITEGGDGNTAYSENTRASNIRRIKDRTHPFLNQNNRKKVNEVNKQRIINGEHPWIGGTLQRETALRRIADDTNPLTIKVTCTHCNRTLDGGNYHRYHGNKCKMNYTSSSSISVVQYRQ